MTSRDNVLVASEIRKIYRRGSEEIGAVDGISLEVGKGEFLAVVGPSGSGKTTLLNILGCLDNPTSGQLTLAGQPVFADGKGLKEGELTRIRRRTFGYIFQKFYLIPTLNVEENIALPRAFFRKKEDGRPVEEMMEFLGLEKRRRHRPSELSGGEMQRVAIARALVNSPDILLADEPTGNLDSTRSREIGGVLRELNKKRGLTVLLVTHNLELSRIAGRVIEMRDGRIHSDKSVS